MRLLVEHGGGAVRPEVGPVTDVDHRAPRPPVRMPADLPDRLVGVTYGEQAVRRHLHGGRLPDRADDSTSRRRSSCTRRPGARTCASASTSSRRSPGWPATTPIPSALPVAPAGPRSHDRRSGAAASVARALAEHGLVEVLTYPFVGPEVADVYGLPADDPRRPALRLANPLSDEQPFLRTWLLPTLVEAARRNIGRGRSDLALFEIGLVTRPEHPHRRRAAAAGRPQRPTPEELAAVDARAAAPAPARRRPARPASSSRPAGTGPAGRPTGRTPSTRPCSSGAPSA